MIYQNYHRHDHYSNVITPDSSVLPEHYAQRAVELGHGIISSVNHGWAGRYIEHYELAKQYGLKFLFGTESYMVKDRFEKDKTNAHIVLLAKNENGRRSINRILSEANVTGYYYKPRIDLPLLFSLPKNDVWVTSACIGGVWKYENYEEIILKMAKHFGKNFFLEMQTHNTEGQIFINKRIISISNRNNIPIVFGCDSHYIFSNQATDRNDYLLSKHIEYEDEDGWHMDYPSGEEVIERFEIQGVLSNAQIKEAMNNTNTFLDVGEYNSAVFSKGIKLPTIHKGKTQEEKNTILKDLIEEKWQEEKENVPEQLWDKYENEIYKELTVVIETGMADYFLLDYEVVRRGKELGGFITLTGRGSSAGFYLSKLLGFTTVDRISATVKLFPERFITKERILGAGSLPDIDFNLGNPEVFAQAQIDVLGENHSYPMIAFGTLRPKAAWKMFARAKGIEFDVANRISEQIGDYDKALYHADEDEKEDVVIFNYVDENYHDLVGESEKYLGIVSQAGQHPCAYLLFDGNIAEEIGLIKIRDNLCCVMDGLWAEKYGFLKNDLLKVSVVEGIYKTFQRIGIDPHPLPELIELCKDNPEVWAIYRNAWTMGINQFEQTNTSGRAAKYAPQNISELSAFVAAVRPGFKSNYKQFEAREPFSYGVPSLDRLIQTQEFPQSYLLYQENAMQVMEYSGVPTAETHDVIKYISKKRIEKVLKYKKEFFVGMTRNIVQSENKPEKEAQKTSKMIWQIIEDSSHYLFNAAHSYCTAGDSLYGAYLKSHYPLHFYETFLRILEEGGDKTRLAETKKEAQEAFQIKFPALKFGQDNRQMVANTKTKEITSSLGSIKGFRAVMGEQLFNLSQNEFEDFIDLLVMAEEEGVISKKFEDLIKINYFDMFGNNKKLLEIFEEFTSGKSRYSITHKQDTKNKRILELKFIFSKIPNDKFPILSQLDFDNDILGYIQSSFKNIDKRLVYVLSIQTKFSPRVQAYCLSNGSQVSLKIQKNLYDNNLFLGGDILYIKKFKKKPTVRFEDGKFVQNEDGSFDWWIDQYNVVEPEKFDEIVKEVVDAS